MNDVHLLDPTAPATEMYSLLDRLTSNDVVVIVTSEREKDDELLAVLARPLRESGVATTSPVPLHDGSAPTSTGYELHPDLPPPPSLAGPCRELCAMSVDAVRSMGTPPDVGGTVGDVVGAIGIRLLQSGWRHVASPGVALGWDPVDVAVDADRTTDAGAWSTKVVGDLVGPANVGLETHVGWARSRLSKLAVVVDGACLEGDVHTGTQHVVIEVSKQLKAVRPHADIAVAVPAEEVETVGRVFDDTGVRVVERSRDIDAEVMYRPYQMLRVEELEAVVSVGRRRLIGQLDMIGFSNPFYHPSGPLFGFARNTQRALMRQCDGVTFISEFGRSSAVAECPDLVPSRLHVVSCGADPQPTASRRPRGFDVDDLPFLLCLSATFWHKNRPHAITTFVELVESTGYTGRLVIAGPEPFYGRSTEADDDIMARLPEHIADRVLRLGQIDEEEKWWLLEHADAVVYPSVVEGFGLVPFEAAAVGTPCLCYGGTAPGELLAGTSAIIDSWSPASWAQRLALWVSDPDVAGDVVAQVDRVARRHTWRYCAEQTWVAIDATLAQPSVGEMPEDGGRIAHAGLESRTSRRMSTIRFTSARLVPAIGRRVRRLAATVIRSRDDGRSTSA